MNRFFQRLSSLPIQILRSERAQLPRACFPSKIVHFGHTHQYRYLSSTFLPKTHLILSHGYQTRSSLSFEDQVSDKGTDTEVESPQVFVRDIPEELSRPIDNFSLLDLPEKIHLIMDNLNYHKPTPIQAYSLPTLMADRDLIGIAQTGSGKTLAYLLPALKKFYSIHRDYFSERDRPLRKRLNPKMLVLAPTRELAVQIFDVIREFKIFKSICLYGGNDRRKQIHFLENNNPLILVSTPGRLKDLVDSEFVNLSEITYLVVDEADRMLDMGFEPQISYLIDQCPKERHTMMFSATWPEEVRDLVNKYLKPDHGFLSIGGTKLAANHNIEQNVVMCEHNQRIDSVMEILKRHRNEKVLVFCNTKHWCNKLATLLTHKLRIRTSGLHGDMSQRQRETALNDFKSGHLKVICATNVAARGLDINDVTVVINFDFPTDIETYVHRIGRTGRKENKGTAYSFFFDNTNSILAKKLIEVLAEANQKVPAELVQISRLPPPTKSRSQANRNRSRDPFSMTRRTQRYYSY